MNLKIMYCKPCGFEKQAQQVAGVIQAQFGAILENVQVESTEKIATFEVFIDSDMVFSKLKKGRFPNPGEIEGEIMKRMAGNNG